MAHPVADPHSERQGPLEAVLSADADIEVIIPVRDDDQGLRRTIGALGRDSAITIVDDASDTPIRLNQLEVDADSERNTNHTRPLELVRLDDNQGPAGARNAGLGHRRRRPEAPDDASDIVAFLDAGIVTTSDDLRRLARHFADPEVVAVAPRVVSKPGHGTIARYEQHHSPLDLGPDPGPVGFGRRLTYVPSACLLVRRSSLAALNSGAGSTRDDRNIEAFDNAMRFGEDVDLVWRLQRLGTIRYEPSVVVEHAPRPDLVALARQRFGYGSAAAPLAVRHGSAVAPLQMGRWSIAVLSAGLIALSRVQPATRVAGAMASVAAIGAGAEHLARRLPDDLPDRRAEAMRLTTTGHLAGACAVARSLTGWAWPVAVVIAGAVPSLRPVMLSSIAVSAVTRDAAPTDRPGTVAIGLVDDVAYGSGVWFGVVRAFARSEWRAARALLPVITGSAPTEVQGAMKRSSS